MPHCISQRQVPPATAETLLQGLRHHQQLLWQHQHDKGTSKKIDVTGLRAGAYASLKGLALFWGFTNRMQSGADGSIPDMIRAISGGFLQPLLFLGDTLHEERRAALAMQHAYEQRMRELSADVTTLQGALASAVQQLQQARVALHAREQEEAREPKGELKRKLAAVAEANAKLRAEAGDGDAPRKGCPACTFKEELATVRAFLEEEVGSDGRRKQRRKESVQGALTHLVSARDHLMSFTIGLAKESLPLVQEVKSRISTMNHHAGKLEQPPFDDEAILRPHIGEGRAQLSPEGVHLALLGGPRTSQGNRALAQYTAGGSGAGPRVGVQARPRLWEQFAHGGGQEAGRGQGYQEAAMHAEEGEGTDHVSGEVPDGNDL